MPDEVSYEIKEMWQRQAVRQQAAEAFLRDNNLVGLPHRDAERLVEDAGFPYRDVHDDNPMSADLWPGRITVFVENGLVVSAEAAN